MNDAAVNDPASSVCSDPTGWPISAGMAGRFGPERVATFTEMRRDGTGPWEWDWALDKPRG